jgi:hypothetical protein
MNQTKKRHPVVTGLLWAGVIGFLLLFGCLGWYVKDAFMAGLRSGLEGPPNEQPSQGQGGRARGGQSPDGRP